MATMAMVGCCGYSAAVATMAMVGCCGYSAAVAMVGCGRLLWRLWLWLAAVAIRLLWQLWLRLAAVAIRLLWLWSAVVGCCGDYGYVWLLWQFG